MTASSVMSFNTMSCNNESYSERMDEPHLHIEKYDGNVSIDDEKSFDSASISITHEEDEPICCNVTVTDGNPSWINKSKKQSQSQSVTVSDETSSWLNDPHDDMMRDAVVMNSCDSGTDTQYDSTTSSIDSAIECQFQV